MQKFWTINLDFSIRSQAVGMDSLVQSALKSILKLDPIFESAAWFFIIILKFIFRSIFEIKIHEKKSLTTKKYSFSKADLSNPDSLRVKARLPEFQKSPSHF